MATSLRPSAAAQSRPSSAHHKSTKSLKVKSFIGHNYFKLLGINHYYEYIDKQLKLKITF